MKRIIIIGAGPAGLTVAYELAKTGKYSITVLEESNAIGGISKTVNYKGNRMDIGGHRFFSKIARVNAWWESMLPSQGAGAKDDLILKREVALTTGGPDPEKTDKVMLRRKRISRIYFLNKFFDYPISLRWSTIKNMGLLTTLQCGLNYIYSVLHKRPENNLESFYINRFGKKLYEMFFEDYTENLWGRHPSKIDASWGEQRVKGLCISAVIKDIFNKTFNRTSEKVETSLIEEFSYPKLGPGELWEVVAEKSRELGVSFVMQAKVTKLYKNTDGNITAVDYLKDSEEQKVQGDIFISSMPLKDLVSATNNIPQKYRDIAENLPYRDYITVGVLVSRLKIKNETKIKTINNIVPDCWVYVQDREVKLGRFQIYNNWSPYLVRDFENTVWLGLEYFVFENDRLWNMTDKAMTDFAIGEMLKIGLIESKDCVIDTHIERIKKAYPAYFDSYKDIDMLISYLDKIENLYCIGRNGQHRYNNMDHSMCTAFEAVDNILSGRKNKDNIWSVNTESEYHEGK